MNRPVLRSVLLATLMLAAYGYAAAATSVLDSDGYVHEIKVNASLPSSGGMVGTVLEYHLHAPDGSVQVEIVAGTADVVVDRDPAIDLDPVTERPVVVWSRAGDTGYSLRMAERLDAGWSTATEIEGTNDGAEHVEASVRARGRLVHVVWRCGEAGSEWLRASFDRDDLALVFGPEWLPVDSDESISPDGGVGPNPDSSSPDLTYFASRLGPTEPGTGSGAIIVWGIRDEPLPITYVQRFDTPGRVGRVETADAGWRVGRFVLWLTSSTGLHYSIREGAEWSEFRSIATDGGPHDRGYALELLDAMLRRVDARNDLN